MPIYEYECKKCNAQFEEVILRSDEVVECPQCKSNETEKLVSKCSFASNMGGMPMQAAPSSSGRSCGSCSGGSCSTCG